MELESSVALSPHSESFLGDQVQVVKREDSERYEIVRIGKPMSFDIGFLAVIRACQLLSQRNHGLILVGLAGPSGAGKSSFAQRLVEFAPSIGIINMDSYILGSRVVDGNFDDTRLTDYDTLLDNIRGLKYGEPVQVPVYDFKSRSRIGYRTVEVPSSRIVILEGIYALSEKLQPFLDLRVSVTGGVNIHFINRVFQDIHFPGHDPRKTFERIVDTAYPLYVSRLESDLETAHINIFNKFDPSSVFFHNPTFILKSTKAVTPEQMKAVLSEDYKERAEETSDIYLLPPGENLETCRSYLRMRNRDGKYYLIFQEMLTDPPFVISPRITFEVNVLLLGGLMTLGYTVAAILERKSHIFDFDDDDKVTVKSVCFEQQLHRTYVQVQGRDRACVQNVANQLGLEASSYVPHTYIELMQQQRRVNIDTDLPDDLKKKICLIPSRGRGALSRASTYRTLPDQGVIRDQSQRHDAERSRTERVDSDSTTQNLGSSATVPVLLALAIGWIGIIAYSLK